MTTKRPPERRRLEAWRNDPRQRGAVHYFVANPGQGPGCAACGQGRRAAVHKMHPVAA